MANILLWKYYTSPSFPAQFPAGFFAKMLPSARRGYIIEKNFVRESECESFIKK